MIRYYSGKYKVFVNFLKVICKYIINERVTGIG